MRCPKCNTLMRVKVGVYLDIPWRFLHRLTKRAIRRGDVEIDGADWPKCRIYCPACGCTEEEAVALGNFGVLKGEADEKVRELQGTVAADGEHEGVEQGGSEAEE